MREKKQILFRPAGAYDNSQLPKGVSCLPLWGRGTTSRRKKLCPLAWLSLVVVDEVPLAKNGHSRFSRRHSKTTLKPKDTDWQNGYKKLTNIYAVYKKHTLDLKTHID